jgi:hypothetical protein
MPPVQVSLDLFALVLDGVLEADGRRRVRALSRRIAQAAQVGLEARCELPRDPAAVSVGDRLIQQTRVVGLSSRVEQLARLNSWLDGACGGQAVKRNAGAGAQEALNGCPLGVIVRLGAVPSRGTRRSTVGAHSMMIDKLPDGDRLA